MKEDSFRDFVMDQLARAGHIECRAMFGGYGLYHSGSFFGIIFKGRLYFKVSEESRSQYTQAGMKPFRPNKKMTLKSFYEVPEDVLESRDRITEWTEAAIRAGKAKITKKAFL